MDIYSLNLTGKLYLEKVKKKDIWSSSSIGRLIFEIDTGRAFLGALDGIYGEDGWIPIGITPNSIKKFDILWNYELNPNNDGISSDCIPCKYNNTITDIQTAITDIECNINNILFDPSSFIYPGSINYTHLDTTSAFKITAKNIPLEDCYDRFISTNVEDALLERMNSAEFILLPPDTKFGSYLHFPINTVENALINLEQSIYTLKAEDISLQYDSTTINIQNGFDNFLHYYLPCFEDFSNHMCCEENQIMISKDGKFKCSDINSNIKILGCASGESKNIQEAYNELCVQINALKSSNGETINVLSTIVDQIGTLYCILEKCLDCDIWNIDCHSIGQ